MALKSTIEGRCHCGNIAVHLVGFGPEVTVSPKTLGPEAKAERWQEIWFGDVRILDTGMREDSL